MNTNSLPLPALYSLNEDLHRQRASSLISQIHEKLSQPKEKSLLQEINLEKASKMIRQFRQRKQQKGSWAKVFAQEQNSIQDEIRDQVLAEISKNESEIASLQQSIQNLKQSHSKVLKDRQTLFEKVLELEKQQILEGQFDARSAQQNQKQIAEGFAFNKDNLGQAVMQKKYTALIEHLVKRLQSNQKMIEYCKKECERRFKQIQSKKLKREEYEQNLSEKETLQRELEKTCENIENYHRKMSVKVKNFESRVNTKLGEQLAKAMRRKRPEKERHQQAYSELNQIIKKLVMSANFGKIKQSFGQN